MYAQKMTARQRTGRAGRPAFPIDDAWLEAVHAWIEREGRGAHARLARAAGIEAGTAMVDEQIEAALKLARRLLERRKPST